MMPHATAARSSDRTAPARDLKVLRGEISAHYKELSRRLQQVGRYVLDHPTETAFETVTVLAGKAGVQPSAVVRFAQTFGYSGFSQMQRVFQTPLASASPSYPERVRSFENGVSPAHADEPARILEQVCSVNAMAIESLARGIDRERLEQAVQILARARHIYIVGHEQCFAVAAYLAFLLPQVDRPAHLVTGLGAMPRQEVRAMTQRDAMIAVGFAPYARETLALVATAVERKTPVVAISDSTVSPLAQGSLLLEIKDREFRGTRSLTAALSLAQALALAVAAEAD